MKRARTWLAAGTVGAVLVVTPAVVLRLRPAEGDDGASAVRRKSEQVTVARRTLTEQTTVSGTLGYGDRTPVVNRLPGTVTWAAAEGSVVQRGGKLFEVDGQPVVLLLGDRPAYRVLQAGSEGADVTVLERNLEALGYDPGTVDDDYTSATADAVGEWQADLGHAETGRVELGAVVVLPAAVRVADVTADPGGPIAPGQPALQVTGTTRVVSVDLESDLQQYVKRGTAVTVTLPDGNEARGTVTEVGRVAKPAASEGGQDSGDPTVDVVVALADAKAAGSFDEAPVSVKLTTLERRDVLAVPVSALLALAEGGYAVEVAGGSLVAVRPGRFAGGWVELTSGVTEGTKVVVPA